MSLRPRLAARLDQAPGTFQFPPVPRRSYRGLSDLQATKGPGHRESASGGPQQPQCGSRGRWAGAELVAEPCSPPDSSGRPGCRHPGLQVQGALFPRRARGWGGAVSAPESERCGPRSPMCVLLSSLDWRCHWVPSPQRAQAAPRLPPCPPQPRTGQQGARTTCSRETEAQPAGAARPAPPGRCSPRGSPAGDGARRGRQVPPWLSVTRSEGSSATSHTGQQ